MEIKNLHSDIPEYLPQELFTYLLHGNKFKLERIVSNGHSTPPGEWYDQETHEWVIVLQGYACLLIAGENEPRRLKAGDYLNIPAHCRHRVEWTDPSELTIWLAIHYT